MKEIEQERIDKLPKWAKEYISRLKSQRETAIKRLNETLDNQTLSNFYVHHLDCTANSPEHRKQYIQSRSVNYEDDKLQITMTKESDCVSIHFNGNSYYEAMLRPWAGNAIRIVPVARSKR